MPEQPSFEQDPITSKSYAAYYLIAIIILMATLFWALWDEDWGQRPWKAYQEQWRDRYTAFLNTARSKSATSEKDIQQNSQYVALKQSYDSRSLHFRNSKNNITRSATSAPSSASNSAKS